MLPFLTAYDPLGRSSGSIDPLGALQTYGLLADMLLPGITTITTRSRYLSMLCAALDNVERQFGVVPGSAGLAIRRKAIEPFERLWALACVAARELSSALAADGLRGITYAEKAYRQFEQNGRKVGVDFKLLKYQGRTGAVGTYWTALAGGDLIHSDTGGLSFEGSELAREFPSPPLTFKDWQRLADATLAHRVSMAWEDFIEWAEVCHLVAASPAERVHLADALTASDRRECVASALIKMASGTGVPDKWDISSLKRLRRELAGLPRGMELGLTTLVDAVVTTECFHEAVLTGFQHLLWWGTQEANESIDGLLCQQQFQEAAERCQSTAHAMCAFREACDDLRVTEAMNGLAGFAHAVAHASSARVVVDEILRRHHQVQSGKVDGGAPKRDWITFDGGKLLRPSPRFQRHEQPQAARGKSMTHPYRLESFVHMLRENDKLPQSTNQVA